MTKNNELKIIKLVSELTKIVSLPKVIKTKRFYESKYFDRFYEIGETSNGIIGGMGSNRCGLKYFDTGEEALTHFYKRFTTCKFKDKYEAF